MFRRHHFTYALSKRTNSDNVTGSFSFGITVITGESAKPMDSPLLPNRSEQMNSSVQSASTSSQVPSPTLNSSQVQMSNGYGSNTDPNRHPKVMQILAEQRVSLANSTNESDTTNERSILGSKAHNSMPCFSDHIQTADKKVLAKNNEENNFGKYVYLFFFYLFV